MEVVALLEFNQLNRSTNRVSSYSFLDCLRNGPSVSADGDLLYYGVEPEGAAGAEAEEAVDEVEVRELHGAEAESSKGTSWRDRREQQQGSCLPPTRLTKFFTHPPHIYNLHS